MWEGSLNFIPFISSGTEESLSVLWCTSSFPLHNTEEAGERGEVGFYLNYFLLEQLTLCWLTAPSWCIPCHWNVCSSMGDSLWQLFNAHIPSFKVSSAFLFHWELQSDTSTALISYNHTRCPCSIMPEGIKVTDLFLSPYSFSNLQRSLTGIYSPPTNACCFFRFTFSTSNPEYPKLSRITCNGTKFTAARRMKCGCTCLYHHPQTLSFSR